ncbi:MAG TPA: hypothetical protein VFF06_07790 [Polyangia bacterium]|nr:hypothetical protein [Polyangia bacterium]
MADDRPKADELLPPSRNFALSLAERVRAQEGVPAHLRRKRQIEELLEAALKKLRAAAEEGGGDELRRVARRLELERLNELIERHNQYYPIEARLVIDVRSGESLDERGRRWQPLPRVTVELLLELHRDGRDTLD